MVKGFNHAMTTKTQDHSKCLFQMLILSNFVGHYKSLMWLMSHSGLESQWVRRWYRMSSDVVLFIGRQQVATVLSKASLRPKGEMMPWSTTVPLWFLHGWCCLSFRKALWNATRHKANKMGFCGPGVGWIHLDISLGFNRFPSSVPEAFRGRGVECVEAVTTPCFAHPRQLSQVSTTWTRSFHKGTRNV